MSKGHAGIPYYYKGVYFFSNIFPKSTLDLMDDFEIREDDVFVITYPRSGTTLSQQIVRLIMDHDGDIKSISKSNMHDTFPFLEQTQPNKDQPNYKILESMTSPRLIKSHLPIELAAKQIFERKPKILFVVRNPKDVVVSFYHFSLVHYPNITFPEFLDRFLRGDVVFGSWFDHTRGWIQHRHQENVMFLRYEDITRDLKGHISKIAEFLLPNSITPEQLDEITELCRFDNMKNNPTVNNRGADFGKSESNSFLRKGVAGDWKNVLTVAESDRIDEEYKKRMEGVDLQFEEAGLA